MASDRPLEALTILDGSTFFVSGVTGDVEAVRAEGFFHADMRHLSRWLLRIEGEQPLTLSSRIVDDYSARIAGSACVDAETDTPVLSVTRERFVSGGVHEDLIVENLTENARELELVLEFASDFGDIFECRTRPQKRGKTTSEVGEHDVALRYERGDFSRTTVIRFSEPCVLDGDRASFAVELGPRETWKTCVDIVPVVDGEERPSRRRCGEFGRPEPDMAISLEEWLETAPRLETGWEALRQTYRQSLLDLAALHFRPLGDPTRSLPAGGLPWYMALFGRDSILTAYQLLPFQPQLARTTLETLAQLRATERDDFRDAEPGKILHELRRGELAALRDVPHSPYYGTHDATPLFLVLLDEYELWTGDRGLVRSLQPAARAAVRWIEEEADLDGDGLLEYMKTLAGRPRQPVLEGLRRRARTGDARSRRSRRARYRAMRTTPCGARPGWRARSGTTRSSRIASTWRPRRYADTSTRCSGTARVATTHSHSTATRPRLTR